MTSGLDEGHNHGANIAKVGYDLLINKRIKLKFCEN